MIIRLTTDQLTAIEAHGESTYPNEGAGFLLGRIPDPETLLIEVVLPVDNKREVEAQYNRYELSPKDYMRAELEAAKQGVDLVGVFHSHPDHPSEPSVFDRDHALPHFAYLITSVQAGKAAITQAWRLHEGRDRFDEDRLVIVG
jgi:proteasome lid subunit RPN8/RPN11